MPDSTSKWSDDADRRWRVGWSLGAGWTTKFFWTAEEETTLEQLTQTWGVPDDDFGMDYIIDIHPNLDKREMLQHYPDICRERMVIYE